MHNWLIFQYHHARAHPHAGVLRGWSFGTEPTDPAAGSDGGTQEGR